MTEDTRVESNLFLPPVSCPLSSGTDKFSDRLVCIDAVDCQFPAVFDATGQLDDMNPRMRSAACPPQYQSVHPDSLKNKTVEEIANRYGRDTGREYDARTGMSLALVESQTFSTVYAAVSTAHLVTYPEMYVKYMRSFVTQLFGSSMKNYLAKYRDDVKMLKASTPLVVHRDMWALYASLIGGVRAVDAVTEHKDADTAADTIKLLSQVIKDGLNQDRRIPSLNPNLLSRTHRHADETIELMSDFSKVNESGLCELMSLTQCFDDWINTLNMLIAACKGYDTTEENSRLMLEFVQCQCQTRCDDMRVTKTVNKTEFQTLFERTNYQIHIPQNMVLTNTPLPASDISNPNEESATGEQPTRTMYTCATKMLSLYDWALTRDASNISNILRSDLIKMHPQKENEMMALRWG